MKIYSVSTKCYFAFGALVSEELSYKLKGTSGSNCLYFFLIAWLSGLSHLCFHYILPDLPKVRWVLPDSYLDVKNKDYGGKNMLVSLIFICKY